MDSTNWGTDNFIIHLYQEIHQLITKNNLPVNNQVQPSNFWDLIEELFGYDKDTSSGWLNCCECSELQHGDRKPFSLCNLLCYICSLHVAAWSIGQLEFVLLTMTPSLCIFKDLTHNVYYTVTVCLFQGQYHSTCCTNSKKNTWCSEARMCLSGKQISKCFDA